VSKNIIPLSVAAIILLTLVLILVSHGPGEEEAVNSEPLVVAPKTVVKEPSVIQNPIDKEPKAAMGAASREIAEREFTVEEIEQIEEAALDDGYLGTLARSQLRKEKEKAARKAWAEESKKTEQARLQRSKAVEEEQAALGKQMLRDLINPHLAEPIDEQGIERINTMFSKANEELKQKAMQLSKQNGAKLNDDELAALRAEAFQDLNSVLLKDYGLDIKTITGQ